MPALRSLPPEAKARALKIHERLCAEYRCPIGYFHSLDPLSELVSSMLSHRTRNADSGRAFKNLRRLFPAWEDVIAAPTAEIEAAISACTWPEQKAPRIQQALRYVAQHGKDAADQPALSLDFLAALPVPEARAWLEAIPGVGPKTSAAVLSFSTMRGAALPVDSHHHRVAQRLALIPADMAVGPSHAVLRAQLPAEWDAQQLYDNHEVLMLHGQKCCFPRHPRCGQCAVLALCPTGQARQAAPVGA